MEYVIAILQCHITCTDFTENQPNREGTGSRDAKASPSAHQMTDFGSDVVIHRVAECLAQDGTEHQHLLCTNNVPGSFPSADLFNQVAFQGWCSHNCRSSSKGSMLINEILSCFSETADLRHKSCSRNRHPGEKCDLQLYLN